jgi:hypothetical protein
MRLYVNGIWLWDDKDTFDAISFITVHCYERAYKRIGIVNDNAFSWGEFSARYRITQSCAKR